MSIKDRDPGQHDDSEPREETQKEETQKETPAGGTTRRQFLTRAGTAGVAAAAASMGGTDIFGGVHSAVAATPPPPGVPASAGFFGRIFPKLPAFAPATNQVRAALLEVGQSGGILDAQDDLAAGPVALITDPTVNGNPTATNAYGTNPDNVTMTAGSTFIGQLIDHDITFDQTSLLGVTQNPTVSPNTRTPALDLDSIFGGGPAIRPDLYQPNADGSVGPKMKIGSGGVHEDIPRVQNADGSFSAVISDPRNDENMMLGGLHCAHILFYNRAIDDLPSINPALMGRTTPFPTSTSFDVFLAARQITLWHYEWLLVNEHLMQVCGSAVVNDVLAHGNRFYRPPQGDGFMPIEFGAACYRFGHSQVRPSYRANFTSGTGDSTSPTADPFFGLIFDPSQPNFNTPADRDDLLGGFPAPRRYIGWQTFFDAGDGQVKTNKKIDTALSTVLFDLPTPTIAPHTQTSPVNLAQRDLLRQLTWSLPSGQNVSRAMGITPLTPRDLAPIAGIYAPFGENTPLWYYVLAEAKAATDGVTLGPMAGRIVAETLIGLLRADPASYLSGMPGFVPFLGTDFVVGPNASTTVAGNRSYTRSHFLHYAGVLDAGIYR